MRSARMTFRKSGSEKLVTCSASLQHGHLTNLGHGEIMKTGCSPQAWMMRPCCSSTVFSDLSGATTSAPFTWYPSSPSTHLEIGFMLPSSLSPKKQELSRQNNTTGVSGGTLPRVSRRSGSSLSTLVLVSFHPPFVCL